MAVTADPRLPIWASCQSGRRSPLRTSWALRSGRATRPDVADEHGRVQVAGARHGHRHHGSVRRLRASGVQCCPRSPECHSSRPSCSTVPSAASRVARTDGVDRPIARHVRRPGRADDLGTGARQRDRLPGRAAVERQRQAAWPGRQDGRGASRRCRPRRRARSPGRPRCADVDGTPAGRPDPRSGRRRPANVARTDGCPSVVRTIATDDAARSGRPAWPVVQVSPASCESRMPASSVATTSRGTGPNAVLAARSTVARPASPWLAGTHASPSSGRRTIPAPVVPARIATPPPSSANAMLRIGPSSGASRVQVSPPSREMATPAAVPAATVDREPLPGANARQVTHGSGNAATGSQRCPPSSERTRPSRSVPARTRPSSSNAGETATDCTTGVSGPSSTSRQARPPFRER